MNIPEPSLNNFSNFHPFTESLKKPTLVKTLTETLESLSLNPNVETIVDITISKSHEIVVDEIRTVLKDKLRALNALRKV